jgi:hypothetical protein
MLERRMLLSLSPAGLEFRANTFTANAQVAPAIAADTDGDFVVVWQGNGSGDTAGIFAQRYNPAGVAQGSEFRVNATTANAQSQPAVAMDADGDFVVVWSGNGPGDDGGVFAQRFSAAGVALGSQFLVNTFTTGGQAVPAVATDAAGNFVIAWSSSGQDGSATGIYAQRYNASGITQGPEFLVNTRTTSDQNTPAIGMSADGRFAIVWTNTFAVPEPGGISGEIYGQRYDAAGAPQGGEFHVNTFTTDSQDFSAIAMDASGDFVVTWHSPQDAASNLGIYAQRYNAAGTPQGIEFRVNTFTTSAQFTSVVAMDSDGDFLVTWASYSQDSSSWGIYGRSFSAAGAALGIEFRLNTFHLNAQEQPAVAMNADGDAVGAWQSNQDGSSYGIYAQRYSESTPDTAPPIVSDMLFQNEPVAPGELLVGVASLTLNFSEEMSVVGGTGGAGSATNPANYRLLRNGLDVSSQIASAAFALNTASRKFEAILTFSSLLAPGEYSLSARDALLDVAGNALDGDLNGAAGGDFTRPFAVSPEFRVNSTTPNEQRRPAIASDADGDFVVVWESALQDGNGYGIYAQRYNRAAIPQGPEFRVNATTSLSQTEPSVAMDADGNFVVVWSGNVPLDSNGIAMQRFNALGVPQGGEVRVNTFTTSVQDQPAVAMDANGNFVVVWSRAGVGAQPQIFAQRFNAAGVQQGSEFVVETDSSFQPSVAMDADGDFVVVYARGFFDHSQVYGRRFNPLGAPQGGDFLINNPTSTAFQEKPAVVMDVEGNFVVTWSRVTTFFAEGDVLVRRFNPAGVPQTDELMVNTFTVGLQEDPAVVMDASGRFVVTWSSGDQDGSGSGVFARRYDAAGTPFTPEFRVNTFTTGFQNLPAVAMLSDEEFVITWTSHGQVAFTADVHGQLFLGPEASDPQFIFDTAPHRVRFRFSDNVSASLGTEDFLLENLTTMQTIPSDQLLLTYDTATDTATFRFAGLVSSILPDGNYRATLLGSGITNPRGIPLPANHVFDFFFLNGDANHDGKVDVADLGILATNWQQSPRTFSKGDFDYNGTVDVNDLGILATNWQQQLAAPSALAGNASTRGAASSRFKRIGDDVLRAGDDRPTST